MTFLPNGPQITRCLLNGSHTLLPRQADPLNLFISASQSISHNLDKKPCAGVPSTPHTHFGETQ